MTNSLPRHRSRFSWAILTLIAGCAGGGPPARDAPHATPRASASSTSAATALTAAPVVIHLSSDKEAEGQILVDLELAMLPSTLLVHEPTHQVKISELGVRDARGLIATRVKATEKEKDRVQEKEAAADRFELERTP